MSTGLSSRLRVLTPPLTSGRQWSVSTFGKQCYGTKPLSNPRRGSPYTYGVSPGPVSTGETLGYSPRLRVSGDTTHGPCPSV